MFVNIMHSRIVSLEKLFPVEMDKFVISSDGLKKPPETAKEPEKHKTKAQR